MNIANLNKNNTKMPFKQLSLILTILLLLFTFSFACSPAVNPTDNNVFTPDVHIKVSDGSTDITKSLSITVDNSNLISITGLSNSVGEKKTYTLTITPLDNIFSTTDGNDISIEITAPITAPEGFLSGPGVLSQGDGVPLPDKFTITNNNDPNPIPYTLKVPFSGAPVEDWLTDSTFSNYFTGATYAGQTLGSGDLRFNFDENRDEYRIAIDGSSNLNNVPDAVPQLTTMDIPSGYILTQNLSVPDGSGLDAITNGNAGSITITEENNPENNTKEYDVTISLAAYASPVMASHISVTGIDGFIFDSTIDIQIEQNIITISGVSNGTSGSGTVTITQPDTEEFTVENNPFTLSFDDSDGIFATEGNQIGTVDIVSALGTVSHTVILSLKAYESPVEASHVTAMFNGIPADPTNIVISGTNIIISGFFNITGSGTVTITQPDTEEFTVSPIDPPAFPFTFDDPPGFDAQDLVVGTVSVTSAGVIASHTIIIKFSAPISLTINSNYVPSGTVTILKDGTVTLTGLGACELLPLPPSTFEVNGDTSATVRGFPSYFDRRIDNIPTGSDSYTLNRDLILEDASGVVLDETFSVKIEGFPACDDASIFMNTGADADNAYLIDSAPKLELVSHLVNSDNVTYASKFYKLTDDIDLGLAGSPWSEEASGETGEGFTPIGLTGGLSGVQFKGTFDCADNSISNLYINKATGDGIGLFGYTSNNAAIQNCSLMNVNVSGNNNVGGLVGDLYDSSITNSYATGSVSGTNRVGGLAGSLPFSSRIENSYASGTITGTGNNVGGLVGYIDEYTTITDSYATGSVSGNDNVGGLVGILSGTSLGPITITKSYATSSVSGNEEVGGLVGSVNYSTITDSYATGSVTGTGDKIGGLAGGLTSSGITKSYATGSVSENEEVGGGNSLVGGLAGYLFNSNITNSYATGSVSGTNRVGGLAGIRSGTSYIINSYATGSVSGTESVGLFIGYNGNASGTITIVYTSVTDSYFNNEADLTVGGTALADKKGVGSDVTSDPATTTGGLTGLSRSALQVEKGMFGSTDPYISWNAAEWNFSNNQYPRLMNVVCPNRQYPDPNNVPTDCTALQP